MATPVTYVNSKLDNVPYVKSPYDVYIGSLESQYQEMLADIRRQQDAEISRIESQYAAAIDELNRQRPQIEQRYEDTAQEAYIQNMLAKRDLPQQLAAQGMTGGLSESSQLALEAAYGNQANAARRDYDNNIYDLETQIGSVRSAQADAVAAAQSGYNDMLSSARNNYLSNLAQLQLQKQLYADEQKQYQDQLDWQQKQWDYQLEQDQIANDFAREQWEWQKNYNQQQADRDWQLAKQKNTYSGSSSGGSSSGSSYYDALLNAMYGGSGYNPGAGNGYSSGNSIPEPEWNTEKKKQSGKGGKSLSLPSMSLR